MNTQHPRRDEFASDVEFWAACMAHLDAMHPEGVEVRRALWQRIEAQQDTASTISRIRDLLALERPFTDDEAEEWDTLTALYRQARRAAEAKR